MEPHAPSFMALVCWLIRRECHHIHAFNFSQRGRAALLSGGDGGGTERKAVSEDEWSCVFEVGNGEYQRDLNALGDIALFHLISLSSYSTGERVCCWSVG